MLVQEYCKLFGIWDLIGDSQMVQMFQKCSPDWTLIRGFVLLNDLDLTICWYIGFDIIDVQAQKFLA